MDDPYQAIEKTPTLDDLGTKVFRNLLLCYLQLNPDKNVENFRDDLWNPLLLNSVKTSGDKVLADMYAFQESNPSAPVAVAAPILVAIAFCAEARQHLSASKINEAWSAMAEARYWCGVSMAGQGIKIAREQTIVAARRNTARKGGSSRSKKYQPVRDEAYRLALEMRPSINGWQSRSHAERTIRSAVQKFANEKNVRLSEEQAKKTIDGWLSEMPEASTLFPRKTARPDQIK